MITYICTPIEPWPEKKAQAAAGNSLFLAHHPDAVVEPPAPDDVTAKAHWVCPNCKDRWPYKGGTP